MKDRAAKYFAVGTTDEIRAVFEGAISLAMLYHKMIGLPVRNDPRLISSIEKAMSMLVQVQPFKTKARVKILREKIRGINGDGDAYAYTEMDGSMFELQVTSRYGKAEATVAMKYVDELNYPLMYIKSFKIKKLKNRVEMF